MRWLTYFILAYLALGFQVGLEGFLRWNGARPNLVLLVAIFVAINAPRDSALLGCFVLGAMQDLVTLQPLGLYALSYGLVGMMVVGTQEVVYREHPLTHFSLALVGGLVTGALIWVQDWIHPTAGPIQTASGVVSAVRLSPVTLFTTSLYTAVLAPVVLGLLQRIKGLFAFQPARRRVRAY